MTKTEEARRLASKLRSVIPPKNHEASRILDSAAFTLRLLAADVNKLEAENEALRAALESIASCNPLADGDVVEIARAALEREEP